MRNDQRGFLGLVGLLISMAIVGYFAYKSFEHYYGFPKRSVPSEVDDLIPTGDNPISQGRSIIDSAKDARDLIESHTLGN